MKNPAPSEDGDRQMRESSSTFIGFSFNLYMHTAITIEHDVMFSFVARRHTSLSRLGCLIFIFAIDFFKERKKTTTFPGLIPSWKFSVPEKLHPSSKERRRMMKNTLFTSFILVPARHRQERRNSFLCSPQTLNKFVWQNVLLGVGAELPGEIHCKLPRKTGACPASPFAVCCISLAPVQTKSRETI